MGRNSIVCVYVEFDSGVICMKTYKEYCKISFEEAKEWEHFDPDGNSPVASVNRSIIKSMLIDFNQFNREIVGCVDFKELGCQSLLLIQLLSLPITYPLFWFLRSYNWNKRSHKEMREEYERYLREQEKCTDQE